MKKIIFACLFLSYVWNLSAQQLNVGYWYLPTMTNSQAKNLANYDILVVDPEIKFNNPEALKIIRSVHPSIKLLVYGNPMEIFDPMFPDKPWGIKILDDLKENYADFFLTQSDGSPARFWPGAVMTNITEACPRIKNLNFREYYTEKFLALQKDGDYDGALFDNAWINPFWLASYNHNSDLDIDNNSRADEEKFFNANWNAGWEKFLRSIRKNCGRNFIIITNPGNLGYLRWVNGKMIENFPDSTLSDRGKGLTPFEKNLLQVDNKKKYNIFNSKQNRNEDNAFFVLVSTLLRDNVCFAYAQNKLFEARFQLNLGKAKTVAKRLEDDKNVFYRRFKAGTIYVNVKTETAWIEYHDGKIVDEKNW